MRIGIVVSIAIIVLFVAANLLRSQIEGRIGVDAFAFYRMCAAVAAGVVMPAWMLIAEWSER
jgi:hypothetical protein